MKSLIVVMSMVLATIAQAEEKGVLACTVPGSTASPVTLAISVINDTSADFVKVTLKDSTGVAGYFSQLDKGQVAASLTQGTLGLILVSETSNQANGVVSNAGFLGVAKNEQGAYAGFLSAKGNLYPLNCQAL